MVILFASTRIVGAIIHWLIVDYRYFFIVSLPVNWFDIVGYIY